MRRVLVVANADVPERIDHALIVEDTIGVDEILDESGLLSGGGRLRSLCRQAPEKRHGDGKQEHKGGCAEQVTASFISKLESRRDTVYADALDVHRQEWLCHKEMRYKTVSRAVTQE